MGAKLQFNQYETAV